MMRNHRVLFEVLACFTLAFAMILFSGSFYEENTEENRDTNPINLLIENPVPSRLQLESTIRNLDVSESGELAIALNDERVIIMDQSGAILRSFRFHCDGDYVVAWSGKNLCLHMRRYKHLYIFSQEGVMLSIIDKDDLQENEIWKKLSRQMISDEHGNCYQLGNGGFRLIHYYSFDQLTKTDLTGETTVLYDVHSRHIRNSLLKHALIVIPLVFFCVLIVLHRWHTHNQGDV